MPADVVPFEGVWRNIWDTGIIIYIDVPVSEEENMDSYLTEYKETLADRFGQTEHTLKIPYVRRIPLHFLMFLSLLVIP